MSERPIPSVGPPWLPRLALIVVAVSSVAFLILWRMEAAKLANERERASLAAMRLAGLCNDIERTYSDIASDMNRADRTRLQEETLPHQVETARRQADLLDGLAGDCVAPNPSNAAGRPLLHAMTMMSRLDTDENVRLVAAELGAWAKWHADALHQARLTDWAAKEWQDFERSLKKR